MMLVDVKNGVPIVVETNNDRAVLRAAEDLAADFSKVTGRTLTVRQDAPDAQTGCIILGTIGRSKIIDQLIGSKKLDVAGISGQWESYVLQVVDNPLPGISRALVIAGSDRRGTIYGIYELSERIGVSPWNWWADVPVKKQNYISLSGGSFVQGPPAVKYRGIFLNDEDWGLRPWAAKTFDPATGNIGPKTYAKIFELLLRLHANYIWPAMHPGTRAFNFYPEDKDLADRYAIVMGSSHCEQMLRDNVDEWDEKQFGQYNYVSNRDGVLKYWEQRVRENAKFDSIYTLGMRGIHDGAMPGGGTEREKAARLHAIIADQRAMLAKYVNTNVAEVPQIFCPYKEVLSLYRLAPNIPDDIALVWPDDNYGYVRQFSNERERQRSGGAGVYYHVSYWGGPRDYLWLCSTPPALIAEEMTKAYDYGASNVWLLNVGDLKPSELDTEFFLKLAWNPHGWNGVNTYDLLQKQLARDFGPVLAPELTSILAEYYRLNFQRKPEHIGFPTNNLFSTSLNGDEAAQRLDDWNNLMVRVIHVEKKLPAEFYDAFFEFVVYPVKAASWANGKSLQFGRYNEFERQGRRANAEGFQRQMQISEDRIQKITDEYNQILGGKWKYMMSANPRNQVDIGVPKLSIKEVPSAAARLGLIVEGGLQSVFADTLVSNLVVHLPQFNFFRQGPQFVDVFNGGTNKLKWTKTSNAAWIRIDDDIEEGNRRVRVDIDWSRITKGDNVRGQIIFASGKQKIPVEVSVFNPLETNSIANADFIEDNHHVVMEAEHASMFFPGKDAKWQKIIGLGYNGEAVSLFPATVPVRATPEKILAESPCLQFKLWLRETNDWKVTVRALPTFSVETGKPQRYAIAFDEATPQIISLPVSMNERNPQWQENVLRNAALTASQHALVTTGLHTLKVWMVDPGIVIDTIAVEGQGAAPLGYVWPKETRINAGH